jgi:hypothetical protein
MSSQTELHFRLRSATRNIYTSRGATILYVEIVAASTMQEDRRRRCKFHTLELFLAPGGVLSLVTVTVKVTGLYFTENKVQHRTKTGRNQGTPQAGEKTITQKQQTSPQARAKQQQQTKQLTNQPTPGPNMHPCNL